MKIDIGDILSQLLTAAHESENKAYEKFLQVCRDSWGMEKVAICVLKKMPQEIFLKFFGICTSKAFLRIDKESSLKDIPEGHFDKLFAKLEDNPERNQLLQDDEQQVGFYSGLYFFTAQFPSSPDPVMLDSLQCFFETISVSLPIYFQLVKLKQYANNSQQENLLLKSIASSSASINKRSSLKFSYSEISGESDAILKMLDFLDRVIEYSDHQDLIYIHGESGTGKSLLASSIHKYSNRRDKPFIEVNCGAIVENLCEAEFFGVAANSGITGVSADGKPGLFELANGGVLFLDEISEMSLPMQASLLTVIEGKPFRRVCGRESIHVNVRIITASIRDIREVSTTQFLPELAERLDSIRIEVPPLRERREDIHRLIDYFTHQINHPERRKNITTELKEILAQYDWPGNIRQLHNCIRMCSFGTIPKYLQRSLSTEQELKTLDQLMQAASIRIYKERILLLLKDNPKCSLAKIAESFGLKRDAFRRRLYEAGTTWDKIKEECLREIQ